MTLPQSAPLHSSADAAAHVLALMVAANGHADPHELQLLDELDAWNRLGVDRDRFLRLAQTCIDDVGRNLGERSWLRASDEAYVNRLLDAVAPTQRLLVCRLGAGVITADGRISEDERLVFDHALARWRISRSMVSQAILRDREADLVS